MAGNTLDLKDVIVEDQLGCSIAKKWMEWNTFRQEWIKQKEEIRKYVYATDTTTTTNSKLPWKNKTTIPKLCQIRDNLFANYMASMFPKRKWLIWEANTKDDNSVQKKESIVNYMSWAIDQPMFKSEVEKMVLDYIDYGNCFATVDWVDQTAEQEDKTQTGYVGPVPKRISPLDIVFNPIAASFERSPKIVRSLVTLGEVVEMLERFSTPETLEAYTALKDYLLDYRQSLGQFAGEISSVDEFYGVDGFTSFRSYIESDYCEVLTFYGDLYDQESNTFLRNHQIMVVDRHKVIYKKPNPSFFGTAPIWHVGWRPRQDNLWAMGPLDNLVGMQYRIDHVENLKADVFDLLTFPPLKIKGYVEDFEWGPMERIYVGDDQSDVEMMAPPFQILQANTEIDILEARMEEMAGSPKEAMGFRTPGEKTKYEVQRLENAASRIFTNKISQFEEQLVERFLNGMLELARRKMNGATTVRVFDDEFKVNMFRSLTPQDITGSGRIRPVAARHFAEQAELVQNLNQFAASPLFQVTAPHLSSVKMARLMEDVLELKDYEVFEPYVQITEQAEAQRISHAAEEQVMMEAQQPAGIAPDDYDPDMDPLPQEGPPSDEQAAPNVGQAPPQR